MGFKGVKSLRQQERCSILRCSLAGEKVFG